MNEHIFTSVLFLENEHIINLYIRVKIKFTIPYIEEAIDHLDCTIVELEELFYDDSFIENFISRYHINVIELEYIDHGSEVIK